MNPMSMLHMVRLNIMLTVAHTPKSAPGNANCLQHQGNEGCALCKTKMESEKGPFTNYRPLQRTPFQVPRQLPQYVVNHRNANSIYLQRQGASSSYLRRAPPGTALAVKRGAAATRRKQRLFTRPASASCCKVSHARRQSVHRQTTPLICMDTSQVHAEFKRNSPSSG